MDLRAVIVDDEIKGIVTLRKLISNCHGISVAGTASSINDAVQRINETNPDLVFLNMEILNDNSFRLLERFEDPHFHVVFLTAEVEYSIRILRVLALDYILKPVTILDVQSVIERVKNNLPSTVYPDSVSSKSHHTNLDSIDKIILSTMEGYYPVKMNDIIYCKGDNVYTHFYTTNQKHYLVSKHLKQFDGLLCTHGFFRIHKSYLINLDHVEQITKEDALMVVMSNHDALPVSFRKKDQFIHTIKNH